LTSSSYEVHTAWNLANGKNLVSAMKPQLVICSGGIMGLPAAAAVREKFRQSGSNLQVLHLPSDFSTAKAGQAGVDRIERVTSLFAKSSSLVRV